MKFNIKESFMLEIDDKYTIGYTPVSERNTIRGDTGVYIIKKYTTKSTNRFGEVLTKNKTQYYRVKIGVWVENEIIISDMHRSVHAIKIPKKIEKEIVNILTKIAGEKDYYFISKKEFEERISKK